MNERDGELLDRALDLAERGRRSASPNPLVGCVIARDGRVLGEGWHVRRGEPHAERNALDAAGEPVVGATAYVSLEPCSHFGRQPPCADALVTAGIARVVCAIGDPNPEVDGRGLERLRAAGVAVELPGGRFEARARRQNAAFRTHVVRGRPFVLLKLAATLDGRIATSTGESRWISSAESRALVHSWRAEFDAVAVGSGTALADDPELLPRDAQPPAERMPLRVVFDRRGRLGADSRLARTAAVSRVLRVAPPGAAAPPAGVEPLTAESLEAALALLGAREVTSLLVEGGAELAAALLRTELVDALALFLAPKLIGGDGRPLLGSLGVTALAAAPELLETSVREVGPDMLVEGLLHPLP
ncbi:MAG: diaminohydroxyphosphoribosylaminopyrimidine deaminase [Gaiellales bacterium]|nr:diaminohydroxyphosphoribosylaminopyrimidine deaminase [Gaiellales bacterium]